MSDPNETARTGGPDAVRAEYDNIVALPSLKGFIFQGAAPIVPPPMLVKGLLPFDGVVFVAGQSGAGKSFVVIDGAVALATGTDFFGRRVTERCGVVFVPAEGRGMIAARVEAARHHRAPHEEKLPIAWASDLPPLMTGADIKKFAARLVCVSHDFEKKYRVRLGAVIIDTVVSAFDLEDENDNSEAARTIRRLQELGALCGALIIPVHHYGKTVASGLRGGSSWKAGADLILSVLADRDDTTGVARNHKLVIVKAREGEEGPVAPFSLRRVQVAIDEDGAPFCTCVVEPDLSKRPTADQSPKPTRENRALRVFREAFTEALDANGSEFRVMGDGPLVRAVQLSAVRQIFARRYATGEDDAGKQSAAARMAFKRALERLAGQIETQVVAGAEWAWRARD
jgi:hypothetical protein